MFIITNDKKDLTHFDMGYLNRAKTLSMTFHFDKIILYFMEIAPNLVTHHPSILHNIQYIDCHNFAMLLTRVLEAIYSNVRSRVCKPCPLRSL